jgi:hypothetical protein
VQLVLEMIRAAHMRALMPWAESAPEVDLVVRHGKAIVPYLMALLPDDPDDPTLTYDHWDEQQALAAASSSGGCSRSCEWGAHE